MSNEQPIQGPSTTDQPAESRQSPLSLSRLREAFAAMLGERGGGSHPKDNRRGATDPKADAPESSAAPVKRPCEVSPRSVVEAILFVGRPDGGPMSARELAAAMRGVTPGEVDDAVGELNARYEADQSPYHVEHSSGGYRLALRPEFERIRDKFYGRIKEARLSPAVIEVLSILAYNQPATLEQLNELRGGSCGAALSTLVRRKLARIDRGADSPCYSTTDRFLKLFRLESLSELPRSEDLEKS